MELSRISALLCICLLALCLSLSVCTAMVLLTAVNETDRVRADAKQFLDDVQQLSESTAFYDGTLPTVLCPHSFYMKESSAQRSSPPHKARTNTSSASRRPEACGTAHAWTERTRPVVN